MTAIVQGSPSEDPCRELDWDSDWWGVRTAQVVGQVRTQDDLQSVDDWCRQRRVELLYFLCPLAEPSVGQRAEASGFRFMDLRVTLENGSVHGRPPVRDRTDGARIRAATADDAPVLGQIASESYRFTRFYADTGLPDDRCDELYRTWIEQECRGQADAVLVAEIDGRIAGYISCAMDPSAHQGTIGLVGVTESFRGRGVGSFVLSEALAWFNDHEATSVSVVTQGRNSAALQLYESQGFRISDGGLWFHKWFTPSGEG
jgi:dTDP-4-amino-4,6-dideoxy-D-galactose acyltransferase